MKKKSKKYNTFAILSLIFTFILPLLGLAFGIVALIQIKENKEKGEWMAYISIIIGGILIILIIILFMFLIAGIIWGAST